MTYIFCIVATICTPCNLILVISHTLCDIAAMHSSLSQDVVAGEEVEVTRSVVEEREEFRPLVKEERGRTEYDIKVFKRMETERIRFHPTPPIGIRFI